MAEHTVVLHGNELRYADVGSGPAVLFVHGILGDHHNWTALVQELSGTHRVVAPDLFGHGSSAKPMGDYSLGAHAASLRDLLDALDIGTVTLVGHSLGGGVAMQFVYLFPERVQRLVLVDSGGLGRDVSLLLRAAVLPGAELVLPVLTARWLRGTVDTAGRLAGTVAGRFGRGLSSDVGEGWRSLQSISDAESRRAFLATVRSVIDPGGQTVYAGNRFGLVSGLPVLIIWGGKDPIIPVQHALDAHAAIPASRLEIFEGAGHFPHLDEPNRFAGLLNEFCAEA